jgi:Protein of unknown function (DUF1761)
MNNRINLMAVAVAGVVYWLVQAGWYTIFSQQWVASVGKTMAELQQGGNSPLPYVLSLACDLIVAYVLARVVARTGHQSAGGGAICGIVLALGLVAATLATNYTFERRPLQFFLINSGVVLVGFTTVGAIVGGWKKKGA